MQHISDKIVVFTKIYTLTVHTLIHSYHYITKIYNAFNMHVNISRTCDAHCLTIFQIQQATELSKFIFILASINSCFTLMFLTDSIYVHRKYFERIILSQYFHKRRSISSKSDLKGTNGILYSLDDAAGICCWVSFTKYQTLMNLKVA